MTSQLFWFLLLTDMALGAFDIFYHHELIERLAWRPSQARELRLHAARNGIYALLFLVLGWTEVHGLFALAVMALLVTEVFITLADFVEEDMSRTLPASERVTHALLALNYGAILVLLFPVLLSWSRQPSAVLHAWHGFWSIMTAVAALGVLVLGLRDFAAALRMRRLVRQPAAGLVSVLAERQTLLITGATGFVGSRLTESLIAEGHEVLVLTRHPEKAARLGAPIRIVTRLDQIAPETKIDAIINLAGESISGGLWTRARRREMVASRLGITAQVVELIARLERRPAVLVNASAIGWYGLNDEAELTEASDGTPCFSRDLCEAWEQEAERATQHGVRVARLRIGLVLGIEGGILGRLLTPFEFGAGGPIGSGRQWMSWIERDDLVRLIAYVVATPSLCGPVNATAPMPERNEAFSKALGHALHRPALLRMPAAPLRFLAGDFARELLLGGQCVLPQKALASGFVFRYPTLDDALTMLVGAEAPPDAANYFASGSVW